MARTWKVSRPSGARRVGDREGPPHPVPADRLDAHVLARPVRERLVRPHGEHGQGRRAQLMADHFGRPPCGRMPRCVPGGRGHQLRRVLIGGGPGRLGTGRPLRARELPERGQQRLADRRVVHGLHAVLAVIEAELAQVLLHRARLAEAEHDPGERPEQPVALRVHGRREHRAQFRVDGEQTAIEIGHRLVTGAGDQGECAGYFFLCRRGLPTRRISGGTIQLRVPVIRKADAVIAYQNRHAEEFATCAR